jgi:hypothetical protein
MVRLQRKHHSDQLTASDLTATIANDTTALEMKSNGGLGGRRSAVDRTKIHKPPSAPNKMEPSYMTVSSYMMMSWLWTHQGIDNRTVLGSSDVPRVTGKVVRIPRVGGLLNHYERVA